MKKSLVFIFAVFLSATTFVHAESLWDFFMERDMPFPSFSERTKVFEDDVSSETYVGSITQNELFLEFLKEFSPQKKSSQDNFIFGSLAFPPSTVEGTSTSGWTDDGSNVRLNTATDFVGIGTTNPPQKLSVTSGNFYLGGDITEVSGTAYVVGDVSVGGGDINLGTGSATTTLTVTSNGLGVGSSSPSTALSVNGGLYVTATTTIPATTATPLVINGVSYTFPPANGASSTAPTNDGNGNLSWNPVPTATNWQLIESTTTTQNMAWASSSPIATGFKNIKIVLNSQGLGSASQTYLQINGDPTSANYYTTGTQNGIMFGASDGGITISAVSTSSPMMTVMNIVNTPTLVKVVNFQSTTYGPTIYISAIINGAGVWNNTTNEISSLAFYANGQTITSGTTIDIWGSQ